MQSNGIPLDPYELREFAAFRQLDSTDLEAVAAGGWAIARGRGVRILGRGDFLDGLYAVLEGQLKLYMLSCHGDERVLRVLRPGDSFGEAIVFNEIPSPVFVDTLSPVRLAYLPRELISEALARSPEFTAAMLRSMSALMRELIQDLETCCLQNALQRTVSYLLREADAAPAPHVEVHLPAPKATVASTLNISAETFSRELHHLQQLGLIEIQRRTLYLRDRAGLVEIIEGGGGRGAKRR